MKRLKKRQRIEKAAAKEVEAFLGYPAPLTDKQFREMQLEESWDAVAPVRGMDDSTVKINARTK